MSSLIADDRQDSVHGWRFACFTDVKLATVLLLWLSAAWATATLAQGTTDLTVTVTNTPDVGTADQPGDSVVSGSDVIYVVKVTNAGATAVRGATIEAALPAGVTQARWICTASAGATCGAPSGNGAIDERVDLAAGAVVTYSVTLAVPGEFSSTQPQLAYRAVVTPPMGYSNRNAENLIASDVDAAREAAAVLPRGTAVSGTSVASPAGGASAPAVVGSASGGQGRLGAGLGAPFTCNADMFISQGRDNDTRTTLYRVDTSRVPFVLTALGTNDKDFAYNALGYNPADNFLYALRVRTPNLIRIHSDGRTEPVTQIAGLPALNPNNTGDTFNAGDIGTDGFMYIKRQGDVNAIFKIDMTNLTGNVTATRINLSANIDGADLAWVPDSGNPAAGVLYTFNSNGRLSRIDPVSGQVTTLPANNLAKFQGNANVGSLFGSAGGLFGGRNQPGQFYQFDLTTGEATLLSRADRDVSVNDGAHCAAVPVEIETDLSVTKTNTPTQGPNDLPNDTYTPGNVVYSIVVTNNGPVGVQNAGVTDPLPPGITTASWTCTATGTGACGAASGTGALSDEVDLAPDETATYLLTLVVPSNYAQSQPALTNRVTVTMSGGFIDPTPNDLTATDTDPASFDLRVVKTASAASVIIGDTLTYTITVTNVGTSDVSSSVLTDTVDARFDCPAASATVACAAQGGAICPGATVPTASLLSAAGITIPSLPAGSSAVFTMTCNVVR